MSRMALLIAGLWAGMGTTLMAADFDGDGTHDIGVYRPASGLWSVRLVTRIYFGSNDAPVPADYSGDGRDDFAVFRSSDGMWAVRDITRAYFGVNGDIPLSAAGRAHDHLGQIWDWGTNTANGLVIQGSVPWSNSLFKVTNSSTGPAVWGINTGGGNGIRGDGYGTSIGVYGEGAGGNGVRGISTDSDGVVGGASASNAKGVYGAATGALFTYGVFGESEGGRGVQGRDGGADPDDSYGIYSEGDMMTTDDLAVGDQLTVNGLATFNGGKSGYVVDVARNVGPEPLEAGDVVVIRGAEEPVVGEIPTLRVSLARRAQTGAVAGVADQRYLPSAANTMKLANGETKAECAVSDDAVEPGEYLTVVTLGAYKAIKVDASSGSIAPGDLLTAAPRPGYAMKASSPQPGALIGKALGYRTSGYGVIPVLVTLH